jgi:signal transduction histidine kinase
MASYTLPLEQDAASTSKADASLSGKSLTAPLLVENVLWFCRIRWIVIALLMLLGLAGNCASVVEPLGLRMPGLWPLVAAAILIMGNTAFLLHAHSLHTLASPARIMHNLQAQIVLDLLILTSVVHMIGSMSTYIAFAYLFHIVLTCIFCPRHQSFAVLILAGALYGACIIAEQKGILPTGGVFFAGPLQPQAPMTRGVFAFNYLSVLAIWLVVWHLASRLAEMVRNRDVELAETNRRLAAVQKERSRHMLTTTHQLKAPFAAIHANAQLLLDGYCGPLPDKALEVVRRIYRRCRRLATEIQEMLQLANLTSDVQQPPAQTPLDLGHVLRWARMQVEHVAQDHGIVFDEDIQPARILGVEDHIRMLLVNLVSNAVNYSHNGNHVRLRCGPAAGGKVQVTISDDGIGIAPEKLSRIFDEYYRTQEAMAQCKESSGLGLAIVRHIVELHQIRLRVRSKPGVGTTFELTFNSPQPAMTAQPGPAGGADQ